MIANEGICPVCSRQISGGVAYFEFGAVIDCCVLESLGLTEAIMEGFCDIGYHGADPEMRDSVNYPVANDIKGGQLEISFCSLRCLREWFCSVIDGLERDLEEKRCFRPASLDDCPSPANHDNRSKGERNP